MPTIKEMPEKDMPREKALRFGIRSLTTEELFAILLRTGTKGRSAVETARALLQKAGGISGVSAMGLHEITDVRGISTVKGLEILACFELARRSSFEELEGKSVLRDPQAVISWLRKEIGTGQQEKFLVVYLDSQLAIRSYKVLFVGTIDTSSVFPREIFKEALLMSSTDILLVHNHPGGSLEPSEADLEVTERLIEGAGIMGVRITDHLIVTAGGHFSFRAAGLLERGL